MRFERDGKTAVILSDETRLLGVIAIADRIRPEAETEHRCPSFVRRR